MLAFKNKIQDWFHFKLAIQGYLEHLSSTLKNFCAPFCTEFLFWPYS